jgi:hypothetical protein
MIKMLSDDLRSLHAVLDVWATGRASPNLSHLQVACNVARGCLAQAKHLEAAQIQPAQRLQEDDFASGKIVRMNIIARKQARP